jgi:hypothetical protein
MDPPIVFCLRCMNISCWSHMSDWHRIFLLLKYNIMSPWWPACMPCHLGLIFLNETQNTELLFVCIMLCVLILSSQHSSRTHLSGLVNMVVKFKFKLNFMFKFKYLQIYSKSCSNSNSSSILNSAHMSPWTHVSAWPTALVVLIVKQTETLVI